jgi:hypothetical protein
MEGVALQRRNRSISIGYDAFEAVNNGPIFESGVDAILTAAATVAHRVTNPDDMAQPDHAPNGRPLKK